MSSLEHIAALVTLVTTVRDGEAYLPTCIESIVAQSFGAWELCIVDDGSTDGSLAIARSWAARDERIRVVALPRVGRRAALMAAHADVYTEFVAWVDADDRLLPEALAKTLAIAHAVPTCGLVYTDHRRIDADGRALAHRARPTFGPHRMLVDFATFHFRLFRTRAFAEAGGIHPALEIAIDYDLCLRAIEVTRVVHLAEPLYEYRVHRGQLSVVRNDEQRRASASAVRAALQRRGLAPHFELAVSQRRFRLVRAGTTRLRPRDHLRLGLAALVRRPRERTHAPIRDVAVWPARANELCTRGLFAGCLELGIGQVPIRGDLARLLRCVWSGAAPDLLVLHGVAPVLDAPGPGERAANLRMLVATLERARAQGSAVVWCAWDDAEARELTTESRDALLRHCDAVIVDDRRALPGIPADMPVVTSMPGDALELVPWVSRPYGRAFFGLPENDDVVVWCGPIDDDAVLARTIADTLSRTTRPLQFLVCGRPTRIEVARALGGRVLEAANVHYVLRSLGGRELACALAAADTVVVPKGRGRWPAIVAALARGRSVVAPDGSAVLPGVTPPAWGEVARAVMAAIQREPAKRASDRARRVDR